MLSIIPRPAVSATALRAPYPGAFDTAGQTGAGRGPAATSMSTTHP